MKIYSLHALSGWMFWVASERWKFVISGAIACCKTVFAVNYNPELNRAFNEEYDEVIADLDGKIQLIRKEEA